MTYQEVCGYQVAMAWFERALREGIVQVFGSLEVSLLDCPAEVVISWVERLRADYAGSCDWRIRGYGPDSWCVSCEWWLSEVPPFAARPNLPSDEF